MFVGIDVSKDQLERAWRTPSGLKRARLAYQEAERQALVARLQTAQRIVVEATGGYERLLVATLAEAGLPVVASPGPGFCPCPGETGQDRSHRRRGVGPLWRAHSAAVALTAGG